MKGWVTERWGEWEDVRVIVCVACIVSRVRRLFICLLLALTGPELAMLRRPGEACLMLKFSSLNFRP